MPPVSVNFQGKDVYMSLTPRSLRSLITKEDILTSASGDFQPVDDLGHTILTRPRNQQGNKQEYKYFAAAQILTKNPLCAIATKTLQDELTSARFIVEERQGNTWVEQYDTEYNQIIEEPNANWDTDDLLRAYVTHLPNFGIVRMCLFGKGDTMPDGSINKQDLAIDIPFPTQMMPDLTRADAPYYRYQPFFAKKPLNFKSDRVIEDKVYNPLSPFYGISTPVDNLDRIFAINNFYLKEMGDFFEDGGMAKGILTRRIDFSKEGGTAVRITDANIEEQIQKVYNQVNRGIKRNIVGLLGDWELKQLGTGIENLAQKDLVHNLEVLVAGAYGVPASIFWIGLVYSNQRASRQMDSITFYARTIFNLMKRIASKFNRHIITRFGAKGKFRFRFDTSQMPLAQFTRLQDNREKERWFQQRVINRGHLWEFLDLPIERLSQTERDEMYQGNKGAGADLNVGAGDQNISAQNGNE